MNPGGDIVKTAVIPAYQKEAFLKKYSPESIPILTDEEMSFFTININ
jgi:hypothetical protein